ncbi:MAG: triphosphoribosyl-dephospho-CoA synthase [Anaerococcus sp.]|nr:triphosphoribosyl-dephospho-CoA synthase [Anaerococcus sp.]
MQDRIENFNKYLEKAIKEELHREISFGCVNKSSTGSHKDMDYKLFIKSKDSIKASLREISWAKIKSLKDLRKAGLRVEDSMFDTTGGINTHKGLIFLTLILAHFYINHGYLYGLEEEISNFSKDLALDYKIFPKAKAFRDLGLKDVRYHPLTGFRDIFNLGKNSYEGDFNNTILSLKLISLTDDTTTLNRSNLKTLNFVKAYANDILDLYKNDRKSLIKKARDLNNLYLANNLSSGGVADIFTIVKIVSYIGGENNGENLPRPNSK